MNKSYFVLLFSVIWLFGCAPSLHLKVTYKSVPSGATILTKNVTNYGTTPLTLRYPVSKEAHKRRSMKTQGMIAYWPDGSSEEFSLLNHALGHAETDGWGTAWWSHEYTFIKSNIPSNSGDSNLQNYIPQENRTNYQDNRKQCQQAQQDHNQAQAKYNAAKSSRGSSRLAEGVGILGMLSPLEKNQALGSLYSRGGRNSANDSQADMNHALNLMQDAKNRMSIYCGN